MVNLARAASNWSSVQTNKSVKIGSPILIPATSANNIESHWISAETGTIYETFRLDNKIKGYILSDPWTCSLNPGVAWSYGIQFRDKFLWSITYIRWIFNCISFKISAAIEVCNCNIKKFSPIVRRWWQRQRPWCPSMKVGLSWSLCCGFIKRPKQKTFDNNYKKKTIHRDNHCVHWISFPEQKTKQTRALRSGAEQGVFLISYVRFHNPVTCP